MKEGEPVTGMVPAIAAAAGRSSPAVMEIATEMGSKITCRMTWSEICTHGDFKGRWVALDGVRYDEATARPTEGTVIDSDDDLAELCNRIRSANRRCCAILFCDEHEAHAPARHHHRHRLAANH